MVISIEEVNMPTRNSIRIYRKKHSINRVLERHALILSPEEYEDLCQKIRNNKAEFIVRLSTHKTVWYVELHGEKLSCIYHKKTNGIVTFCNNKWLKNLKKMAGDRKIRMTKKAEEVVEIKMNIDQFFKKHGQPATTRV